MDEKALFRISYGLYLLTAHEGARDNGCIINTLSQVTNSPNRLSVVVNKSSLTHDMILRTGLFTASVLTEETPFSLFERFGFHSGRDMDKFRDFPDAARTGLGLLHLTKYANAFLTGRLLETMDMETHTLFFADIAEAEFLSQAASLTYDSYYKHVKPAPQDEKTSGWRCRVCGYVYEGEELPADFICPWCKHGTADFERIGA